MSIPGYKQSLAPRMSPGTMRLWQELAGKVEPGAMQGVDQLSKIAGGDPSQFEAMEKPAFRQFQGAMGNLASRFSNQGSLGARRSSGFGHQASAQAQSLAENLQSKRMGMQQDAIRQLLGLYETLMGNDPYEYYYTPKKQKSSWKDWLGAALPFAGAGAGALLGGPAGATLGGSLGSGAAKGLMM